MYSGPQGAVAQLRTLESWFRTQREFHFYSASILILYEGDAQGHADANVRVRFVDFAHTFHVGGAEATPVTDNVSRSAAMAAARSVLVPEGEASPVTGTDDNFLGGMRALITRLTSLSRYDVADTLM